MATTNKSSATAAAVLLMLLVATAVVLGPAEASTLTVFSGPACAGQTKDINGCGCFNITGYQAGFQFVFTQGQAATLYTGRNCDPRYPFTTLNNFTRRCDRNNFTSVNMIC